MNEFQKSQAEKIKACYESIDLEKAKEYQLPSIEEDIVEEKSKDGLIDQ